MTEKEAVHYELLVLRCRQRQRDAREESRAALGTQFALIGFFLLNTIGLCAILGVLYRGQFRSQEKLLEIEYRLADLAEKFDKQQTR